MDDAIEGTCLNIQLIIYRLEPIWHGIEQSFALQEPENLEAQACLTEMDLSRKELTLTDVTVLGSFWRH